MGKAYTLERPVWDVGQSKESESNFIRNSGMLAISHLLWNLFPRRLALCAAICLCGIVEYYLTKCVRSSDGNFVSVDMYLPKSQTLGLLSAMLPNFFPVP